MGDSAHTVIQLTIQPGTTHCHQKIGSKYSRNTKKLDVTRWDALYQYTSRKPDPEISLRTDAKMGPQNDALFTNKRTVLIWNAAVLYYFTHYGSPFWYLVRVLDSSTCTKFRTGTCAKNSGAALHGALALLAPLVGHRHSEEKLRWPIMMAM